MKSLEVPFNLTLLELTDKKLMGVREVSVLDVFEGSSKNFHSDGLFSTMTFGQVGDVRRYRRYGYIDIKLEVFHPLIFNTLEKLKSLYKGIMSGKEYAAWDDTEKDFVKSNQLDGRTGYSFFISHWKDIDFKRNSSNRRDLNIEFIEKFKKVAMTSKILVLPAGIREYEIDAHGKESENEFNDIYRKFIRLRNVITSTTGHLEQYDNVRYALNLNFCLLYDTFQAMVQGKRKLIMGKWATRSVQNTTRNVLTSDNTMVKELFSKANVSVNDTVVGMYQLMKAMLPVAKHAIKSGFISEVFEGANTTARLVDKKTLMGVSVNVSSTNYDMWMTDEGLDKVISAYGEESLRSRPLEMDGYYVGLLYTDDVHFMLMHGLEEFPWKDDVDKVKKIVPVNLTELLYISLYKIAGKYPALVTRYPITDFGSTYPSKVFLKPTVKTRILRPLLPNGTTDQDDNNTAYTFPIRGVAYVNAMSPHTTKIKAMGADYDGDTGTFTVGVTDDTLDEIDDYLQDKKYYISIEGTLNHSVATDTVDFLLKYMTGDPQ